MATSNTPRKNFPMEAMLHPVGQKHTKHIKDSQSPFTDIQSNEMQKMTRERFLIEQYLYYRVAALHPN